MRIEFRAGYSDGGNQPSGDAPSGRVSGVAYSGGVMPQPFGDVVIDLYGIECAQQVPLMNSHRNTVWDKLGEVTAVVSDGALRIDGTITARSPGADYIIENGKSSDWQLSVGGNIVAAHKSRRGEVVNGSEVPEGIYVVERFFLREVSVVAIGADSNASMRIIASYEDYDNRVIDAIRGEMKMPDNKDNGIGKDIGVPAEPEATNVGASAGASDTTDEAVAKQVTATSCVQEDIVKAIADERRRVSDIRAVCAGEFPDIEAKCIDGGLEVNEARRMVLEAIRAKRPSEGPAIFVKENKFGVKEIEAALSLRAGVGEAELERSFSGEQIEAGMKNMDISLKEVVMACLDSEGVAHGRTLDNECIRAAFSTVSLPGILSNVANKKMLDSFREHPIIATKLCTSGDINDFKPSERFRITDVGDLLPVAPDGEIKEGGVTEEAATNKLDTYGKKFCLTRQMIINDDLGAFMKVPTAMGNRAARLIDQLFFSRLLGNPVQRDGNALFSTAHRNILSGADSALSLESLQKAIQLFMDQVDADGQPISVEPTVLLVPTALKHLAVQLTKGTTLVVSGGSNKSVQPSINVIADENLQVVSSPYLGNGSYTGSSVTGWYLFGSPSQVDTFEIGYLRGKRTPTVERGETDFNTLGQWFRVYFDIGVREQDHRGMVYSSGK